MSDLNTDAANELSEFLLDVALKNAKAPIHRPTGKCLNCGEPITQAFCDSDCKDDYEQRMKFQANGKKSIF